MSLKRRIARLECRFTTKQVVFPTVVFGESNRTDIEVIGAGCNGNRVERHPDETVELLAARSGRELREKILFLNYADGSRGDACIVFPNTST